MDKKPTTPLTSPNDIESVEREKALVSSLGDFLSKFHWRAYATPTFAIPVNMIQAKRAVDEWIEAMGIHPSHGTRPYAYVAYEVGKAGGRTHCHVLLGGVFGSISRTGRLWKRGDILIEKFDPKRGATFYCAKFPNDGELVGELKRHRSRRRRNRSTK